MSLRPLISLGQQHEDDAHHSHQQHHAGYDVGDSHVLLGEVVEHPDCRRGGGIDHQGKEAPPPIAQRRDIVEVEEEQHDERDRLIRAAIAKLPDRQRTAITLTYSEGLSNAEVADALGTTVSAVETLLARGKQNLRRALGGVIEGE